MRISKGHNVVNIKIVVVIIEFAGVDAIPLPPCHITSFDNVIVKNGGSGMASTPSKADLETMKSELSHSIAEHTKRIVMLAQMADADDELVTLAEALNEQKRRLAVVVDLLC